MPKAMCLLFIVLFPLLSWAASFDCMHATTKMEKTICDDPALSKKDEELASAYSSALKETSDPAAIKKQQREWLMDVRGCSGVSCLMDAYTSRIAQLTYPEDGIWTGTVGKQEVMACFAHYSNPEYENFSGFYFLHNSQFVALISRPGGAKTWVEGSPTSPAGVWNITERYGNQLQGNRSDAAGKQVSSIRLSRFRTLSQGDTNSYTYNFISNNFGCESEHNIFDAATIFRMSKDKVSVSEILVHEGKRYRALSALDGAVSSLELIEPTKVGIELNVRLVNELKVQMSDYYHCPTGGIQADGKYISDVRPDYNATIEIAFWNERLVSFIQRAWGDCGGAHPFSGFSNTTWDLLTGEKIVLGTWLNQNESSRDRLNKIIADKAVKQRLVANPKEAQEDNNCLDVIRENTSYEVRLGKKGLVFSADFPHVVQACGDDIEIPYKELLPYLTKNGKDAVTAILKSAPSMDVTKGTK